MAIKKQEFYEGAALHLLARSGRVASMRYNAPFFIFNDEVLALLKYNTKTRSPWGFTFSPDEQVLLQNKASKFKVIIGLICGADGIVAITYDAYQSIVRPKLSPIHISCYRNHGEYYEVNGPDGTLDKKVPPSLWQRILEREADNEA